MQDVHSSNDVRKVISALPTLERSKLLELWRSNFGRKPPDGIRRELIVPMLAYRIQENAFGGLRKQTILKLQELAAQGVGSKSHAIRVNRLKIGTRLVRSWRGQTYEVEVVRGGFLHRGTVTKSLSEIACRITGTRWSGPRFFGLKTKSTGDRRPR